MFTNRINGRKCLSRGLIACILSVTVLFCHGQQAVADVPAVEIQALIATSPDDPDVYIRAGQMLIDDGDIAMAVDILEKGRLKAAVSPALLVALGAAYEKSGRIADAVSATHAALAVDSQFAAAHVRLGQIYWKVEWQQQAIESLEMAVAVDTENSLAKSLLVYCMAQAGRPNQAEQLCSTYLAEDARDTRLWIALGEVLEIQKRPQDAFACYGQALTIDQEEGAAHARRGRLFCNFGQFDEAATSCRIALRLDPNDGLAHAYLSIACAQLHQEDDARSHAEVAEAAGFEMQTVWAAVGR